MLVYMNNLHGRDHEHIYGSGAFFDLDLTGRQAAMLPTIGAGQTCIVASCENKTEGKSGMVVFKTYIFEREAELKSEVDGVSCRVLFGTLDGTVKMSKDIACEDRRFEPFFNKDGNFRRPSVRCWPPAG